MRNCLLRKAAAAAALAVTAGTFAALPVSAADDFIFSDGFESGEGSWKGRGGASVTADQQTPYAGSGALFVSGRTDAWNGAEKDVSGICKAGEHYAFSACARYDGNASSVTFMLSLAYKDASGTVIYDHIAQAETMSGFYVQLYNDDYMLPSDASDPVLYVETKSGSTSFYLDEVICAKSGTQITGPAPKQFRLGDVDCSGSITAADLTLAKRYAGRTFPDKTMQRAADVDCSGTVDADDLQWMQQYLLGRETEYPEPVKPPVTPYAYDANLQYHRFDEDEYLKKADRSGQVIEEHYAGPKGQNMLYVYLPPGYDENQKYNIFYLMHGGNENEKTLFFQNDTMMQNIFDHMIQNGELDPLIVVTPTFNQSGAENFWSEYREKVVPFVEGKYSTYAESTDLAGLQASRMHRAYGGFSMGAVSTWAVLTHCLDITAYYMPLSGDHWGGTQTASDKARAIAKAVDDSGLEKNQYFIMCATGTKDIAYQNIGPQVEEMKKLDEFIYTSDLSQGNFYFLLAQGPDHWWGHVRHYVYDMLPYFFHEGQ
ncbi:MAG TPA: hypothetical protein DCG49_02000 [Ruminococcus sp.]|nr:hypothetical protein [Ruminococcus sp.]